MSSTSCPASPSVLLRMAGDWDPLSVRTRWAPSTFQLPPGGEQAVETAWQSAMAQRGRMLFDGPLCRLESCEANAADLTLTLSRTSYRLFWGTHVSHPEWAVLHGPRAMANCIGLSPALQTSDGYLMLGRRNMRVAYYPGRIHPFAGSLEPVTGDVSPGDPGPDLFAEVQRELSEELGIAAKDIDRIRLVGLVEDTRLHQPELIFLVRTHLSRSTLEQQLDEAEHRAAVAVVATADGVAAVLADPLLTPVAVASLLLWGRHWLGESWFHATWPGAVGVSR